MKRNELAEVKKMETKALVERVKKTKLELSDLVMDKNMNKLKSLKDLRNKKRDLAQIMTILNQKQILSELEVNNES